MSWLAFVAGAFLSWGVYGAMLHQGQVRLGNPMRALLCVGVAYFLIGVLVPIVVLYSQGQGLSGFNREGTTGATLAGALGALGAVCIIFAFRTRGLVRVLGEGWERLAVIPDDEMAAIERVASVREPVLPFPYLAKGQRVRITAGPLTGVEGFFVDAKADRGVLVVSVNLLQRSVAVSVDATDVTPAN
jgi:hypothetical protein